MYFLNFYLRDSQYFDLAEALPPIKLDKKNLPLKV